MDNLQFRYWLQDQVCADWERRRNIPPDVTDQDDGWDDPWAPDADWVLEQEMRECGDDPHPVERED